MTARSHHDLLDRAGGGHSPTEAEALTLADCNDLPALMQTAAALRDRGHGANISYSRKVFIPLTKLCRDSCHYCTFAQTAAARRGRLPDARTRCSRSRARASAPAATRRCSRSATSRSCAMPPRATQLAKLGYETTLDYLAAMAALVLKETGLLPHLNPGVMSLDDIKTPARGFGVAGHHAGDRRRAAVARKAARISARPTSGLRCGLRRSARPARRRCRSRPAS